MEKVLEATLKFSNLSLAAKGAVLEPDKDSLLLDKSSNLSKKICSIYRGLLKAIDTVV